jgi:hypothetical protein
MSSSAQDISSIEDAITCTSIITTNSHCPLLTTSFPALTRLTVPSPFTDVQVFTFPTFPTYTLTPSWIALVAAVTSDDRTKVLNLAYSEDGEIEALRRLLRHVQVEAMTVVGGRSVREEGHVGDGNEGKRGWREKVGRVFGRK